MIIWVFSVDSKESVSLQSEVLLLHALSNKVPRAKGWEDVPYDFLSMAFNIL